MSTSSHDPNEPGAGVQKTTGMLQVAVPHWSAQVRVYNDLFQPMPDIGQVREQPDKQGAYETHAALPPGIYEVETMLAGQSARQLVAVYPNQTARIEQDAWGLKLTSAAPLAGTSTTREAHTAPAEEWSRKTTWKAGPGGDSRMFLFVRTLQPERYRAFADGLYLLNENGEVVTDFSTGVEKDLPHGWMAFNADLPAGCYIMQRVRRGVRPRHQIVYLSPGWETHVFLAARNNPSLRTLTLNMAPRGAGFQPDDEATSAADAVLDSLRRSSSDRRVVASEKVNTLLHGKIQNPWLGILAAYALLRSQEDAWQEQAAESGPQTPDVLQMVLNFLTQIGDHPDVRALRLDDNAPAAAPFRHPPLLRAGLLRVQRHAMRFAETVPLDGLTDCVLDNQLTDSPWTAWRHFDRPPKPAPGTPAPSKTKWLITNKPARPATDQTPFFQSLTPRAPVFRLEQLPATAGAESFSIEGLAGDAPESSISQDVPSTMPMPAAIAALGDAPLIQMVLELTQSGALDAIPGTVTLNLADILQNLLNKVKPETVSAACGLSLARTTQGLERLQRRSEGQVTPTTDPELSAALTPVERAILEYALQQSEQERGQTSQEPAGLSYSLPEADAIPEALGEPAPQGERPLTIEDVVTRLRAEMERLLRGEAREQALRLRQVADTLLKGADFIVITDPADRMLYGNGAFIALLALPDDPTDDEAGDAERALEARQEHQRGWEAALVGAALGQSSLPSPVAAALFAEWDLRRTAVENDASKTVWAHLNILRGKDAPTLAPGTLEQVNALLPQLSLAASCFRYGSSKQRAWYLEDLNSLTTRLESIVEQNA